MAGRMTLSERIEHRTGLTPVGIGLLGLGIAAVVFGQVLANPGLAIIGLFLLLAVAGTWLVAGRGIAIAASRASGCRAGVSSTADSSSPHPSASAHCW